MAMKPKRSAEEMIMGFIFLFLLGEPIGALAPQYTMRQRAQA